MPPKKQKTASKRRRKQKEEEEIDEDTGPEDTTEAQEQQNGAADDDNESYNSEEDEDFVPDAAGRLDEEDKKLEDEYLDGKKGDNDDTRANDQDNSFSVTINEDKRVQEACERWSSVLQEMNAADQQQLRRPALEDSNGHEDDNEANTDGTMTRKRKRKNQNAPVDMENFMWKLSTNRMKKPKEKKLAKKNQSLQTFKSILRQGDTQQAQEQTTQTQLKQRNRDLSKIALEAASNSKDIKTGKSKIKLTETIKYAGKEMNVTRYLDAGSQAAKDLIARKQAREVSELAQHGDKATTSSSSSTGTLNLDTVVSNLDKVRNISTVGTSCCVTISWWFNTELNVMSSKLVTEKSSSDWDIYKQEKRLDEDELLHATKDGYLHRQEFLSRVKEREEQS
eukprot:gb/GECG01000104.1/.p1 GENE.gb/GECG01000104.1/~~gb/GECG01000104.1/.p1  ORF type:complete len:394 (+),score=99.14 gb/GECG01000104.1/:1-1182(+)